MKCDNITDFATDPGLKRKHRFVKAFANSIESIDLQHNDYVLQKMRRSQAILFTINLPIITIVKNLHRLGPHTVIHELS